LRFPTAIHRQAAEAIVEFAMALPVEAVLLVNSCARGVAVPESDLDLALLIDPATDTAARQHLDGEWLRCYEHDPVFAGLCVHLDFFDGNWSPEAWDDGGGPDAFEIEIGNRVQHCAALWERGNAFSQLRSRWLPYYGEDLRSARLPMVLRCCHINLDRVSKGAARGLHFYAFDRLYHAFQEFLQALFIAHRVYPIAYNKWIREQVEEWLGLPELYHQLPAVLECRTLEPEELHAKAAYLSGLLESWVPFPAESFSVVPIDPRLPEAAGLIAEMSSELARLYDHADDGSGNFRPEDVLVPRSVFLVCRIAGRAVACGALRPIDANCAEIKRMYVAPAWRGHGLARAILHALERFAVDNGYTSVRLETGVRQPQAIAFYESAGYRRIPSYGSYTGSPHSICFEKPLPRPFC
jgi:putative acetyltransferase